MLDKYGIKIDGFLKIGEQKGDAIKYLYKDVPLIYVNDKTTIDKKILM